MLSRTLGLALHHILSSICTLISTISAVLCCTITFYPLSAFGCIPRYLGNCTNLIARTVPTDRYMLICTCIWLPGSSPCLAMYATRLVPERIPVALPLTSRTRSPDSEISNKRQNEGRLLLMGCRALGRERRGKFGSKRYASRTRRFKVSAVLFPWREGQIGTPPAQAGNQS